MSGRVAPNRTALFKLARAKKPDIAAIAELQKVGGGLAPRVLLEKAATTPHATDTLRALLGMYPTNGLSLLVTIAAQSIKATTDIAADKRLAMMDKSGLGPNTTVLLEKTTNWSGQKLRAVMEAPQDIRLAVLAFYRAAPQETKAAMIRAFPKLLYSFTVGWIRPGVYACVTPITFYDDEEFQTALAKPRKAFFSSLEGWITLPVDVTVPTI
jgi:hypothetical protein